MEMLLKVLGTALAAFALLVALNWMLQDRYIFYPRPPSSDKPRAPVGYRLEELTLAMSDGKRLETWLTAPIANDKSPLVIYFGGNAEEVSSGVPLADRYAGFAALFVNYRGYGRSEGKPGERELFSDALEIYDQMTKRPDIDARRIVVHGVSLGSGVAVFLASQRPVRAVILTAPYDSIRAMGEAMMPYLPVSMILRHPFDSLSRAPSISAPLLCLAATQDEVIPITRSRRLFDAWGGPKAFREISNEGHNTIGQASEYWRAIAEFLST